MRCKSLSPRQAVRSIPLTLPDTLPAGPIPAIDENEAANLPTGELKMKTYPCPFQQARCNHGTPSFGPCIP